MQDSVPEHEALQERLVEWQQGDFSLDCGEFWFRDVDAPIEGTDETTDFGYDPEVAGFVVISQTCDIVRDPSVVPYVTICPLITVSDQTLSQLEKGVSPRNCFLANCPENIVADLSRAMSVSKELLVTWERKRGCRNSVEQLELARALEGVFGRFAFPDDFVASVGKFRRAVIETYSKDNSELGRAFRSISEFRVLPHEDWSAEDNVPVTFIAVLDELENRELKDRSKIAQIVENKLKSIKWVGVFSLHEDALVTGTYGDLTAADYINSFPLELNSLSFARRYTKDSD